MTGKYILLRGGTVLTHSTDEHVIPLYNTDVLVHHDNIVAVGKAIDPPSDAYTEIIECRGRIVSPGFVDTHHHVWQTQLKGRHADQGLVAYMVSGMFPCRMLVGMCSQRMCRQHHVLRLQARGRILGSIVRLS